MLDKTALLKEIKTRDKPHTPYYNKYIRNQRRTVKTRERTWLKYRQQHQWHAYKIERNIYNRLLKYHKNNASPIKFMKTTRTPKASLNL